MVVKLGDTLNNPPTALPPEKAVCFLLAGGVGSAALCDFLIIYKVAEKPSLQEQLKPTQTYLFHSIFLFLSPQTIVLGVFFPLVVSDMDTILYVAY